MALSKIRAGFSNVTTYSADSSSNTIPTNADKLLFVIAAGGGGGAASFAQAGGNGGNSTVVYNSVTYTATGGTGADITCLLYTSPSPRDDRLSRMPSSA